MLEQLHGADAVFAGKKVLIVDDDVRNIFALTSVLEAHGMSVLVRRERPRGDRGAEGRPGRRPRADGRDDAGDGRLRDDAGDPGAARVRAAADHRAHREGDEGRPREVIASGASDYITKPVDTDQLLSLMRVWLYQ